MKKLLIALSLFSMTSAFATSYCYDYGLFALSRVENEILSCEGEETMNASIQPFELMEKRLYSSIPFLYEIRALKALSKLDTFMNQLTGDKCLLKVKENYFSKERAVIHRSIKLCSL